MCMPIFVLTHAHVREVDTECLSYILNQSLSLNLKLTSETDWNGIHVAQASLKLLNL